VKRWALILTLPVLVWGISSSAGENATDAASCLSCHDSSPGIQNTHFINSSDDCRFCHEPHGSGLDKRAETIRSNILCLSCHAEQDPSYQQSLVHTGLQCTTCHNPHGSDSSPMLVRESVTLCTESCHTSAQIGLSHPVGTGVIDKATGREMTCVSACHSIHDAAEPKLLQLADLDLCAKCHGEKF
jgi:predicted CXXCH cytochrome family protein